MLPDNNITLTLDKKHIIFHYEVKNESILRVYNNINHTQMDISDLNDI